MTGPVNELGLSPLEIECLRAVCASRWPDVDLDAVRVLGRANTGVGKFVMLQDANQGLLPDGWYEASNQTLWMEGLVHPLDFVLMVREGRMHMLELVSASPSWDGVERPWRVETW